MSFSEWVQVSGLLLLALAAAWTFGDHFGIGPALAVGAALLVGIGVLLEHTKGV